jgi:hypothetical protein
MKKKIIVTCIVLVIIVIFSIYFKYIFGWLEFRSNNYTSKKYKSIVHASKEQYSKDSLSLVFIIRNKINKHQDPYYNAVRVNEKLEYINDSLTKIYIDSIFYSPDFKKIAFLVLVENENKKQYKGMTRLEAEGWTKEGNLPYDGTFFDGNCFLTKRMKSNIFDSIFSFSRYSFINFRTYKETSLALRNDCLNHSEDKNEKKPTYNVDDIRFWNTDDWDLIK